MSLGRYAVAVLAVVALTQAAAWSAAGAALGTEGRRAVAAGGAIAAVNTLAAYGLALWSAGRSTTVFLGVVLGGMVGRMGVMLAAVVVAVLGLELPKVPLAVSLLGYFVAFLVAELWLLHRTTSAPRPGAAR